MIGQFSSLFIEVEEEFKLLNKILFGELKTGFSGLDKGNLLENHSSIPIGTRRREIDS